MWFTRSCYTQFFSDKNVTTLKLLFCREEEKRRAEQNHESRKQEMLDLVNDPVLRRVSKKTQNIPKYSKPPDSRPTAVCFDIDGPSLTHSVVKFQMDTLIEDFDDFEVKVSTELRKKLSV